ncbi:MAG: hypothetical protein IJE49_02495 [Agathobacter sp.]|nr:hypothetical protein [Agathobacter sp.]
MLFGEDSLKGLKKELKSAGADMSFVKSWQKTFDKVKKGCQQMESQYTQAKTELEQVHTILKKMEASLIEMKSDVENSVHRTSLGDSAKELKKYQGHFNQEFLISKEDKEFHLTYQTILELCSKGCKEQKDVLILQSEVENILAVTEEALDKEWPSYRAMAYFYIDRTDREIFDLPHSDKVVEVNRIYENEFLTPMRQVLTKCFDEQKVNDTLEVDVWN